MTQVNTGNLVFLSVTKRGVHAEPIYHLIAWRLGDGQPTLSGGSGHHSLPRVASSSYEARPSQNLDIRV